MPAATVLLAVTLLAAGAYALLHDSPVEGRGPVPVARAEPAAADEGEGEGEDLGSDPHGQGGPGGTGEPGLGLGAGAGAGEPVGPGAMAAPTSGDPTHLPDSLAADDESPSIEWSVPAGWRIVANASSMRIATYAVPHAAGDAADGDVSVTRAGGAVAANVARWQGQFEGASPPAETTKMVRGLEVTLVSLEGTYAGGMDPSAPAHPGWALLAAIVRSRGQPYFFKMTGPAATVRAARPAFDGLVASIKPVR
ncbi:MAG TPA: hypothetical protein VIY73_04035 [Polyangiaceae bacterium]